MKIRAASLLIALVMIAGCSNRAIYENLQQHQRNQCLEDSPVSRHECLLAPRKTYEEYKREREEHLEKSK